MIINDADVPQFATPKRLEFGNKIIAKTSSNSALSLPEPLSLHFPVDQIIVSEVFDFASTLYIVGKHNRVRERCKEKPHKLYSFIQFNCMPCDFALLIGYNREEWGNLERKKNLRCSLSHHSVEMGFWS